VLGVINASPGDLSPVFDAMLERALALCDASFGMMNTYDGQQFHAAAERGVPVELAEFRRQNPLVFAPGTGPALILAGESIVHRHDVMDQESYRDGDPMVRNLVDLGRARTLLAVALRKEETLVGILSVYRQEVRPFTEKQIALLQNFAVQAVIAIENARLLSELRQRTGDLEEALEQQTATAEVLGVINSSPGDLGPVFDAILEKAHILCDADIGSLLLNENDHFRAVAVRGGPKEWADRLRNGFAGSETPASCPLLAGENFVHIADLSEIQHPMARAAVELSGARTLLSVPLRGGEALFGMIVAVRCEVQPYTDKEIALVQNFAAQAVIAMENARLLTETREALEQQTATAEVLGVINASPGDLTPVFDTLLEKAMRLCGGTQGALWTLDGERAKLAASRGNAPEFVARLREHAAHGPPEPVRQTMRGRLLDIADLLDHRLYREDDPIAKAAVELGGVRSLVGVALIKDDASVGALMIGRPEVRPFTDKQIALLQNFAQQAVIAIENARLITETREALQQQTATAEVLGVINSSPGNLTPVFEAILEKAHSLCGATYGGLLIHDGDKVRMVAAHGDASFIERWRQITALQPPANSPLRRLMRGENIIHFADAPADENYRNTTPIEILRLGEFGGIRTLLMVPLRSDSAFLGAITAFRRKVQPFTQKQIALLQNFAAQAVIAIENARLLGELRQRTEEVAELNRGLEARVAEQVDELGRVGRLKRFLAPQLAELIVSHGDEKILESHRREIVVVFCDLRGYTAFTETAEPEEVLEFLRQYHGALGPLVSQF
jgi:GAF domain-containing protein